MYSCVEKKNKAKTRFEVDNTHSKIYVLDVSVPLKFECELIEVPYAHLGFVCARSNDMMTVAGALYADAGLWKLEMLDELYGALDVFANCALSLGVGCTLPYEPIWQGGC
jgi:hypothetical protein